MRPAPGFPCRVELLPAAPGASPLAADGSGHDPAGPAAQDVGNAVLMEHINLEVPDLEVARLFYGEGLGLAADPSTTGAQRGGPHVVWYNIGRQQFHIARGSTPQRLPAGSVVGLVMPHLEQLVERMEAVKQLLGDVSVTYARGDTLEVTDPYGNTFVVHASLPYFPARQGIAYVQLPCFKGTAHHIAAFYARRLGARCRLCGYTPAPGDGGSGGGSPGATRGSTVRAEVVLGPGQRLLFVEQSSLGQVSDQAVAQLFGGWHVALYLADFSTAYEALHADQPAWNDHPYRDKEHSLKDALRNHQFRFQDITAEPLEPQAQHEGGQGGQGQGGQGQGGQGGQGGQQGSAPPRLVYRISHEVRSMHHPLFARALYNREGGIV